jgi:hypothetical protein
MMVVAGFAGIVSIHEFALSPITACAKVATKVPALAGDAAANDGRAARACPCDCRPLRLTMAASYLNSEVP